MSRKADLKYQAQLEKQQARDDREKARLQELKGTTIAGIQSRGKSTKPNVQVIESRAVRRQEMRNKQIQERIDAGEEDELVVHLSVRRDDGSTLMWATAVEDIRTFLQDNPGDRPIDEVSRGVGIDLRQDERILESLRHNPLVEVNEQQCLKYRPPHGVRNRGALMHLLSRTMPGSGETEAVLRSDLRPDLMYAGVETDMEELLAQGRCVRVDKSEKFNQKGEQMDYVLFAAPKGLPATEEVKAMWRDVHVPEGKKLQDELVHRGVRTQAQLDKRLELKAAANQRAKEAEDRLNPKKQRTGQVRTWANTHLQMDSDSLLPKPE